MTYEAGPTGYELAQTLIDAGHVVQIAMPSNLLRPSKDRVKTDKNDALVLARLARNDDITPRTGHVRWCGIWSGPGMTLDGI